MGIAGVARIAQALREPYFEDYSIPVSVRCLQRSVVIVVVALIAKSSGLGRKISLSIFAGAYSFAGRSINTKSALRSFSKLSCRKLL